MNEPDILHQARQYLSVIHKRRALIVTCLAVSLVTAFLYNYTTRPLYQASAQIFIEVKTPDIMPTKELMASPIGDLATEFQLLQGRALAEKAVERLDLQKNEEFQTGPLMSPWERIQRRFLGGRSSALVDNDGIPLSPAVAAFRSRVSVQPLPGNKLVNLRFTAYDPALAAAAANTLAQLYIEQAVDIRFSTSSDATNWLSERMKEQQEKIDRAQQALIEYRQQQGSVGGPVAEQRLATLESAMLTARTERIAKESLLQQARALSPADLLSLPQILAHPSVAVIRTQLLDYQREQSKLSETLGEKHPEMVRIREQIRATEDKLRSEAGTALRGLEAQAQTARQQEANLQASLESARRDALDVSRKSVDYDMLKRELDSNQELYQSLLTRAKQTGLETKFDYRNVRLIEKAEVPGAPFSPQKNQNYKVAFLIGLGLGLGISLLFEHLDNTFKTPDDIKQYLDLPFLGMVPDVRVRTTGPSVTNAAGPSPLILRSPKSSVAEAYRVLRTNLIFSSAVRNCRVLIVSSANPGEGKTTTVANLAASLAINGSRVLAVDADLRRPTMHQHFNIAKAPGLSDLIVGKCRPSDVIQKTQFGGLQVLPCGYVPPNPTELLGSVTLREILAALRTHYDWVLIDTPPVLAMADTAVLCPLVDGVVIVVGAETSSRPAVQRSIDQISSVNGRMLGVILNKVNFERNSYYYGQYYGEYYRSYYAEKEDAGVSASQGRGGRRV